MNRRRLLKSAVALGAASLRTPLLRAANYANPADANPAGANLVEAMADAAISAGGIPVVDAHIHLFDPSRPGGIPWPEPGDTALYQPALPPRYEKLAAPHGVVAAIAVECSPWLIDNFWLQEIAEQNPIMAGYIGDLLPESPDFAATLDRLHRSPFFLGIRYGNLWNRDPSAAVKNLGFIKGLKLLADADLVLETANPNAALIRAMLEIANHVPSLRIVIDHLPHADPPADAQARAAYERDLRELASHECVFVKGSEIIRRVGDRVVLDGSFYRDALDEIWELFGEGRIFFGSDWPNSDSLANYNATFCVARDYIASKSRAAQEKYFWLNSRAVYRWKPRTTLQSALIA